MVDWQSPATLLKNAASFTNLLHALLGVYAWEWVNTLDFEWSLLTGKQTFRWPLIFYFYCRYSMLGGLIGFTISLNETTHQMNCDVLYRIMQFLGNTALGAASINLSIRTMAIYKDNKYIVYPLIAVILGHWGIIIKSITNVNAAWVDGVGCTTTSSDPKFFIAMYAYTMVFDFIVLCLLAYKLRVTNRGSKSQISHMMFVDGLGYFFMAFFVNLVAVVFSVLNLNAVMSIVADVPATTFATIFSCRVVRRLYTFQQKGPQVYSHSGSSAPRYNPNNPSAIPVSGVHVQMATFVRGDDVSENKEDVFERADVKRTGY